METKICNGCGGDPQPIVNFNWRNKAKGQRHRYCQSCQKKYQAGWYQRHKETHLANNKRNKTVARENLRERICEYLKVHPCVDCGEKDIVVLQFDHMKDKAFAIAVMIDRLYSWARVLEEIEKCQVRCANCHIRRTTSQRNWYKQRFGSVAQLAEHSPLKR